MCRVCPGATTPGDGGPPRDAVDVRSSGDDRRPRSPTRGLPSDGDDRGLDSARCSRSGSPSPSSRHASGTSRRTSPATSAHRRGPRGRRRAGRVSRARPDRVPAPGSGGRGGDAPRRSAPASPWRRRRAGCRRSSRSSRRRTTIGCSSPPRCWRTARSASSTASSSCRPTASSTSAGSSPPGDVLRAVESRLGVRARASRSARTSGTCRRPRDPGPRRRADPDQRLVLAGARPGARSTRLGSGRRPRGGR